MNALEEVMLTNNFTLRELWEVFQDIESAKDKIFEAHIYLGAPPFTKV